MALVINPNAASIAAQKDVSAAQSKAQSSTGLSSGNRIADAANNSASLAISDRTAMQPRQNTVTDGNTNDAVSMGLQAQSSLGDVGSLLGRMRDVASMAIRGPQQESDRKYVTDDFNTLKSALAALQDNTKFNGKSLINENDKSTVAVRAGNDTISIDFGTVSLKGVLNDKTGVGTVENAKAAMAAIDEALKSVSTTRGNLGMSMNSIEASLSSSNAIRINPNERTSRIRTVDAAEETAQASRDQILSQAGTAVLAQANSNTPNVLGLLR